MVTAPGVHSLKRWLSFVENDVINNWRCDVSDGPCYSIIRLIEDRVKSYGNVQRIVIATHVFLFSMLLKAGALSV